MGKWAEIALGTLAAPKDGAIAIGPFGSSMKADTYTPFGVPVIRGTNISNGRAWKGDWVYISDEFADAMPRCVAKGGTLVFPHRGSIGEVAIVPEDDHARYFLSTSLMKIEIDERKANPLFVYFFFRSREGRSEILKYASQVGTPGIGQPLSSLRQFKLPLPPLNTQNVIASVLGALVDKIDLNRRMNETLEAIARAIFKDWFVDFGPTRAKMEGSAPYLAPEIWALFPDRLNDEGKPEGWRVGTLGEIARSKGQSVKPNELSADTPYIGLEHMPRRSLTLDSWEDADKVTSGKLAFRQGDILFGKLRPYFHKVGIAPLDGICSTDIVVMAAKEPSASAFVLCCVSSDEFVAYTDLTSGGTKMPRTSWEAMERYELCLPPFELMQVFENAVRPLFGKIVSSIYETRTLATTRDFLLPKLMSGEIRVKDAGKIAEAAL